MTGEHVQDLLLDLAYGELPADRAAEVEAHLATCEVCRAERDEMARTRALVAPLRSLEEPRPGFDERIIKSARAEAGLQADGTPGTTIEVSGSVKPLGLQAARVDPLAPGVKVARKEVSKRVLWRRRAIAGASIAGAAAVALIVATSSVRRPSVDRSAEVPELKVRAPTVASGPGSEDSLAAKDLPRTQSAPIAPPPLPQGSGGDLAAPPPSFRAAPSTAARELSDAAKKPEEPARKKKAAAPPAPAKTDEKKAQGLNHRTFDDRAASQPSPPTAPAPQATRTPASEQMALKRSPEKSPAETRARAVDGVAGGVAGGQAAPSLPIARPEAGSTTTAAEADLDPDRLEESAGQARRAGSYPRAAELYKLASGLRRSKNDTSRAAWDLAHAVECLAAASKLREAGDVRTELMRSYPSEEGPQRAANRALGWPASPQP
ncbi:MAG: hypothetical protein E6J85_02675 [Deltaproteobacteria bacterium]|nr:MAG: hypothetical protein E6J85_02675 [Deltaproteobacteria bacterium]TMB29459.1 MAG: hypothetical protein E6J61_15315 [Deltaproteobacteria bacterium]